MRLILIRHGETDYNRNRVTLGRADIPLNEHGRAQARAIAASFTRAPAAIYASPLSRAADTARMIGAATGVAVTLEPDLIEMDVGEMEHLTPEMLREQYPEFLRAWLTNPADAQMPGGEMLSDVQQRAWRALERIRSDQTEGEIVVVTHNFVIGSIVCRALELPLSGFRRLKIGLASRTALDMRDGGATLIQLNDDAHLRAAGLAGG